MGLARKSRVATMMCLLTRPGIPGTVPQREGGGKGMGSGVDVQGQMGARYDEVLTPDALGLLAELHGRFDRRRRELLALRQERYAGLAAGGTLDFLPETREVREAQWQVAPAAPGLVDRRVEITGPTDRKMTVNALNSGAKVWLADFEDASTPQWANVVGGQLNLRDAIDRRIDFTSDEGKEYRLGG